MSKYGDLIKEARKHENSDDAGIETQNSGNLEKKNSGKLETKKTRKQEKNNPSKQESKDSLILESKDSRIPESENTGFIEPETPTTPEKLAGISIKVPESLRRHWVVESKRKGKSMTSVIIEALTNEFGAP